MKLTELRAEGHCGIQINLNVMDQYEITHAVERMELHNRQEEEHREWKKLHDQAGLWKASKEERDVWFVSHPEPVVDLWDWKEEMAPIYVFLRKLVLNGDSKPTVFDE